MLRRTFAAMLAAISTSVLYSKQTSEATTYTLATGPGGPTVQVYCHGPFQRGPRAPVCGHYSVVMHAERDEEPMSEKDIAAYAAEVCSLMIAIDCSGPLPRGWHAIHHAYA